METRANFITVGIFVLSLFLGGVFFLIWVGKSEISGTPHTYATYFTGSVSGLRTGAQVFYNGVPVGSVLDISIDEQNVEKVQVLLSIKKNTPIKKDAVASLEMQGLTGLAVVQITGGTQESPLLKKKEGQRYFTIQSKPSKLEYIFSAVPELLRDLKNLLGKQNQEYIRSILLDIKNITENFSNQSDIFQDTLENMNTSIKSFNNFTDQLSLFIKRNNAPLSNFLTTGLLEFTQLISQMRITFETVNNLASSIESISAPLLTNSSREDYYVH